ncbi:hypothetical protein SNOUR_40660 [Streptomyces noursei ATCC 11455]|nr:hypothetical protein SNOUR_40660 [Streptomyces noursei ATCC 11455]
MQTSNGAWPLPRSAENASERRPDNRPDNRTAGGGPRPAGPPGPDGLGQRHTVRLARRRGSDSRRWRNTFLDGPVASANRAIAAPAGKRRRSAGVSSLLHMILLLGEFCPCPANGTCSRSTATALTYTPPPCATRAPRWPSRWTTNGAWSTRFSILRTMMRPRGELDAAYWSENPLPLRFPSEITDTGFAVAGATSLPVVKNGRRSEAAAGERLNEEEVDPVIHHGEAHGRRTLPRPLGRYAPRRAAPVHRRGPPRRGPQAGRRRILRRSGARRLRHRPRGRQGAAGRGHPPCATGSCSSAGSPSPSWRPATVAAGTGPGRTRPRTAWARPTWKAAPSTSPHRNCPSSAT